MTDTKNTPRIVTDKELKEGLIHDAIYWDTAWGWRWENHIDNDGGDSLCDSGEARDLLLAEYLRWAREKDYKVIVGKLGACVVTYDADGNEDEYISHPDPLTALHAAYMLEVGGD